MYNCTGMYTYTLPCTNAQPRAHPCVRLLAHIKPRAHTHAHACTLAYHAYARADTCASTRMPGRQVSRHSICTCACVCLCVCLQVSTRGYYTALLRPHRQHKTRGHTCHRIFANAIRHFAAAARYRGCASSPHTCRDCAYSASAIATSPRTSA